MNITEVPDYMGDLPSGLIQQAMHCLNHENPEVREAFHTGNAVGIAEGKAIAHQCVYHRALQVAGEFTERFDAPHLVDWVTRPRPPLTNAELRARLKGAA